MIESIVELIRFVPYILVGIIAFQKHYPRLVGLVLFVTLCGLLNVVGDLDKPMRDLGANIFAFILLVHALDLQPRKKKER